jgi:uncharacterized protein (DUF1778 family)
MAAVALREARSETISLRVSPRRRDLIDRAAEVAGKTRTDFILDSATRAAEDTLLDQRVFMLDATGYAAFVEALDAPPRSIPELRKLLTEPAPWER